MLNMLEMVGVGPFITLPLIVAARGGPQAMLGWILGAALALCDGLVWAELAAAFGTWEWELAAGWMKWSLPRIAADGPCQGPVFSNDLPLLGKVPPRLNASAFMPILLPKGCRKGPETSKSLSARTL